MVADLWRRSLSCLYLLSFLLAVPVAMQAQRPPVGAIRGRVLDETGAALAGVEVIVTGPQKIQTTSDGAGAYVVEHLEPGDYAVQATLSGFVQRDRQNIRVGQRAINLNIAMRLSVRSESVTVQDEAVSQLSLNPGDNAATVRLKDQDLRVLSNDPDDLQSDIRALAGPGAGLGAPQILVDGVPAGDAVLPNKSAIAEIKFAENPFAPEFDSLGFGRAEIITKSGASQYHGTAFFNGGDGRFNSRNPFVADKPPFDLRQYGGSLGGPLDKRSWFFLDVDRRSVGNGAAIRAVTVDPATFSLVDPYTEAFVSPFGRLRVAPRLDLQLTPKHLVTLRYAYNQNDYSQYGVGSFNLVSRGADAKWKEHSVQLTDTAVLGPQVVNETRVQFLHQFHSHEATEPGVTINVLDAFNAGGDPESYSDYIHHHYLVQNYTTIAKDRHTWRFGVRLRAVSMADTSQENFLGVYTFGGTYGPDLDASNHSLVPGIVCDPAVPRSGCNTISSIEQYRRTLLFRQQGLSPQRIRELGGGATQFLLASGRPLEHVGGVDVGLFAGDDWKIRPNFTLSMGLRYENQSNISDHFNFAPRIGFAWSPTAKSGASPGLVIRGGFGVFYDRFSEDNVLVAQRYDGVSQQQYLVSNPDFFPAVPAPDALSGYIQTQTTRTIDRSMKAPYLMQSLLSVERQLPRKTTLAITYSNSRGVHLLRTRNINAPLPGTYSPTDGGGILPYSNQGPIYQMESTGVFNQNQLVVNLNSRFAKNLSIFGSYTLNRARSDTDGLGTFPATTYSMAGEYAPAENDIRHRMTFGSTISSKWGIQWNPLVIAQTGAPFNITTGQDLYGDRVLAARPAFAADPNEPGVVATPYGLLDPNPKNGQALVPRNYGRSPGIFAINLRVGKTFTFNDDPSGGALRRKKYTLSTSVSARNVLNRVNPGPIIGNVNSPLFGTSNRLAAGVGAFDNSANNRRLTFELELRF